MRLCRGISLALITSLNCVAGVGFAGTSQPEAARFRTLMTTAPFLSILTAVSWTTVVGVGAVGLALEPAEPVYHRAVAAVTPAVTKLEVPLSMNVDAAFAHDEAPAASATAVLEQVLNDMPPAAPSGAAMAAGSQVAFAIPVAAPASIVGKSAASSLAAPTVVGGVPGGVADGLPVTKLTRGNGFARGLPAPAYPEEARLNGWEGSVTVRFALDSTGRVMVAKVVSSSGRPLLDREALDTVRRRWSFPSGSPAGPFDWTAHFVLE